MSDIAKFIRIFNSEPDDDFVSKRTTAIKSIEDTFRKSTTIDDIFKLANNIAKAIYSPEELDPVIVEIVEKALKKQSASFVAEGQSLQISICALLASLQYLEASTTSKTLTISDVFAISMWSALTFQTPVSEKPKIEELRLEILTQAKKVIYKDSVISRGRLGIPELKITAVDDPKGQLDNIVKAIKPLISNLTTNAVLDREEIDVLWWKLNDWSQIAKQSYAKLDNVKSSILGGIDLSTLLRRLPHESHYRFNESNPEEILDGNEISMHMQSLLEETGKHINSIKNIDKLPEVFPLFHILTNKPADVKFLEVKRTLKEWSERALLEGTMINLGKFVNDGTGK